MKVAVISLVEKTLQFGMSDSPNGAAPYSLSVRVNQVVIVLSSKIARPARTAANLPILVTAEVVAEMPRAFLGILLRRAEYVVAYADGSQVSARLDVEASEALRNLDKAASSWTEADLLLADNGFIFFRKGSNRVLDQHQGLFTLNDATERTWQANIRFRSELAERIGAPIVTVVIPNKETVYRHLIPQIPFSDRRPVRLLSDIADRSGLSQTLVVLEDQLHQAALDADCDLYDRTTAYWNGFGAALAFNILVAELRVRGLADAAGFNREEMYLLHKLCLTDWGMAFQPAVFDSRLACGLHHHKGRLLLDNHVHNRGHCRVYSNPTRTGRVLVFCDSFVFNVWWQFFAERFGTVVLAHQAALDAELIDLVRPDLVVCSMIERFLANPPNDLDAPRFITVSSALNKSGGGLKADLLKALEAAGPQPVADRVLEPTASGSPPGSW